MGILAGLPGQRTVTVVDLPGLAEGEDVADYLVDHSADDLLAAVEEHGRPATCSNVAVVATGPDAESLRSLIKPIPEPEPYPVDALGADLAAVVDAISEYTAVPAAMAAQSILAAVALAVQKHGNLTIDGRVSPASLFCMTVAQTGDRKTAVDAVALSPHRDWQDAEHIEYLRLMQDYERDLRAYKAALKRAESSKNKDRYAMANAMKAVGDPPVMPLAPSLLIGNMTSEGLHRQLNEALPYSGVFSDEGGSLIGGFAMNRENVLRTLAEFSSLWGISNELRVRAGAGLTNTRGKRLSMHVMAQPDVARILFGQQIAHNQGFLPRLLVTWPETLRGTRMYRRGDLSAFPAVTRYNQRVKTILETPVDYLEGRPGCLDPRNIPLSNEAYETWIEYHNRVESQNSPDGPLDCISGWASKAAEHAARIACVLSLYDRLDVDSISLERMQDGIRLADFYLAEMYRTHAQGENDADVLRADTLLQFMRAHVDEVENVFPSKYLLQYGPYAIRDAIALEETLLLLQSAGTAAPIPGSGKKWRLI
ncbi:MAG: hypothetical protein BWY09_02406 [Candidatus Hydrogenedentes bacterium ADurb.Bin179]|nr:MAG: hypothetical protein BWY09_02406 [Candidatus Hydrogenedentes bacterium ADurb.Bin179]